MPLVAIGAAQRRATLTRQTCALALLAVTALVLACAMPAAHAATFPSKPLRIIVPFPPGAFNDQLARLLAQKLGERWKQPVVVDNRPGGSTVLGTDLAARAAPDGHTLLIVSFAFAVNPSLMTQLPYDTRRQFTPVVLAAATPNMLVVNPTLPVRSVRELIDYARRHPGKLDYATAGNGTSNHLCMELFKSMARVDLVHVPYRGSAPAVTDLLGGQVKVMFDNVPNVLPHVKAGKLRALAVSSATRSEFAPDLPSVAEGGVPGYDVEVWFGVVAPAGTPKSTVTVLNTEINRVLALPEVKERFAQQGVRVVGGTPEQFGVYLNDQMARWAQVVKETGVRIE
ncbi:MAG: tripartite tricarboxylate transporter substrate binding protein [Burkholderiales bacterium]|nr:tripartite tricarboxylate transporter substrate binding protein [Burkholderiales bacterium]